jgi:hypothetical protein
MLDGLPQPEPLRQDSLPVHDLDVYERNGGHTLSKHVNVPPGDELRRIREEHVAAAGSFRNRATAQRCIYFAIKQREELVRAWLRGRDRHAPLTFVVDMRNVIGRTLTVDDLRRGSTVPRPATEVRLVLRRCPELPGGFTVVTAYPTRRLRHRPRFATRGAAQ